jgi:ureidoacrylate peracid hydrolase
MDVLWELDEQVRPDHAALVVVDVQNDFVHPDGWCAREAMPGYLDQSGIPAALERVGDLLAAARARDLVVVLLRNIGDERYQSGPTRAVYRRLQGGAGRPVCTLEGTWGADLHDRVRPVDRPREFVVDKHRYSGFAGTRLDLLLRSHGVRTVVVCGFATSGCVESTVRDAFFADYYVVLAEDACGDYAAERHRASTTKIDLSFGRVVPTDAVVDAWRVPSLPPPQPASPPPVQPAPVGSDALAAR